MDDKLPFIQSNRVREPSLIAIKSFQGRAIRQDLCPVKLKRD